MNKFIVMWISQHEGTEPGQFVFNRLTANKDGRYAGARVFDSLGEAMRAARKDRDNFISEERKTHGDDVDIKTTGSKRQLTARSKYATVTWAVIQL